MIEEKKYFISDEQIKLLLNELSERSDYCAQYFDKVIDKIQVITNTPWHEKTWVAALAGSLVTALLYWIYNIINFFYKNKKLKFAIAKNIYLEIATVVLKLEKRVESNFECIKKFEKMAQNQNFTGSPAISFVRHYKDSYYKIYAENIFLLGNKHNDELVPKIMLFYDNLYDYDQTSLMLENRFKNFYNKNVMTSYKDVVKTGVDQYRQARLIVLNGYDIMAKLIIKFKVEKENSDKVNKKEIIEKLKKTKTGDVLDVNEKAKEYGTNILFLIVLMLQNNLFKNDDSAGKYVKIN